MSFVDTESTVTILSYESGICTIDKVGKFAVELDFSSSFRLVCGRELDVTLRTDASDNRVRFEPQRCPFGFEFYVATKVAVNKLNPREWTPALHETFIFGMHKMLVFRDIIPAKPVPGAKFTVNISGDSRVEPRRRHKHAASVHLLEAVDESAVLEGSTSLVSLVSLEGHPVKFALSWFGEAAINRYKHDIKAGLSVETDYTLGGLSHLRHAIIGTPHYDDHPIEACDIIDAAKAAHCFEFIDCAIELLDSLPTSELSKALSDVPFSGDPRFSTVVARVLGELGLKLPQGATFTGTSLGDIFNSLKSDKQPAKRARISAPE